MGDKETTRSGFNIPIRLSVVDVIVSIVVILVTAFAWYNLRGKPAIKQSWDRVAQTREAAIDTIDVAKGEIRDLWKLVWIQEARRDSMAAVLNDLQARIPREIEGIQAAQDRNQALTSEFLTLRGRLGNEQDRLRERRAEAEQRSQQREELLATVNELEAEAMGADQERLRLQREVEEMVAYRERDPWSMFPVSASLSAYAEFTEDATFVDLSLAKDFYRMGSLDWGLTGTLGFGSEQGTSLKEAGVYANIELAFRKASLDIGMGLSSIRVGTSGDDVEPYVSLMLRYAPYYRERAFLLLGAKYSHDALSYLAGVGFGRR